MALLIVTCIHHCTHRHWVAINTAAAWLTQVASRRRGPTSRQSVFFLRSNLGPLSSRQRLSRQRLGQRDGKGQRRPPLFVVVQRALVQAAAVHAQQPAVGKLAGQDVVVLRKRTSWEESCGLGWVERVKHG